jgi:hypothetical protein
MSEAATPPEGWTKHDRTSPLTAPWEPIWARRAERACVALGNEEALNDTPREYLNRLSDLMFVLARVLNRLNGGDDVYWKSQRMHPDGQPSTPA